MSEYIDLETRQPKKKIRRESTVMVISDVGRKQNKDLEIQVKRYLVLGTSGVHLSFGSFMVLTIEGRKRLL